MFDIGFFELVLISIIGLVVLGPQRLPSAIKTVSGWIRAIKNLANTVQDEFSEELRLQELQESIKKAEELNLKNLSPELSETIDDLKRSAKELEQSIKNEDVNKDLDKNTVFEDELAELAEEDEEEEIIFEEPNDVSSHINKSKEKQNVS
ncbi:Sec-independent protein translocase protein TatB [Phocoenobacter skyensis]|uniref:Sec-independent protein translocase protein TatB n=1 Tax=Phocoenobacter skyensis TaxID=97481 RepID=A0A1H7UG22_9PAST|nr:Sec-independent protein translocase protein TatB [Pasteurella skyensis]MDP8080029.1 Sec-independent protein translocase protein TatB [Pasteurella skyensis]MDP8086019.1 Sec-independent protein translocase protein TatB [Pasteurella skyensis]MDP8162599.1 Sec-independent protein translocase protein TatB [Pasteurella skyensis]MDP8169856.1 Sec-independent protein translocase protein TatB [Pasteurella skyensis]MDP8172803.1 Sec-independent protein translocase protein TatB [Pasteurella skyensis]